MNKIRCCVLVQTYSAEAFGPRINEAIERLQSLDLEVEVQFSAEKGVSALRRPRRAEKAVSALLIAREPTDLSLSPVINSLFPREGTERT